MVSEETRPKTIIVDLDGTVFPHRGTMENIVRALVNRDYVEPYYSAREAFTKWERAGYNIIVMTGRPECIREETVAELKYAGLFFTQLIMGVGGGVRVLINDRKPDGQDTAFAINVDRSQGIPPLVGV